MAGEGSQPRLHVHGVNHCGDRNSGLQEMMMNQVSPPLTMIVKTLFWLKRPSRQEYHWNKFNRLKLN
jgi:hypothetical protein